MQCINCCNCVKLSSIADEYIHYSLDFDNRDSKYVINTDGLDDIVKGTVHIESVEPRTYLRIGGGTYFQFAGPSQKDECLGNLQLCPKGNIYLFCLCNYKIFIAKKTDANQSTCILLKLSSH